jgi:hypothetical protein
MGVTITVKIDTNPLSPNRMNSKHWTVQRRLKKAAADVAWKAWLEVGRPVMNCPVDVHITIRRRRVMDPDNALSSLKAILDVLFKKRIVPDDSAEWVRYLPIKQQTGKAMTPEVEFRIERRL